jgi:hypothetical protein
VAAAVKKAASFDNRSSVLALNEPARYYGGRMENLASVAAGILVVAVIVWFCIRRRAF